MRQCDCGRAIDRLNGRRCARCIRLAELHGRWDGETKAEVDEPHPHELKRKATKTGRLDALLWCHMTLSGAKNHQEFLDRLNREIAALEDDD